MQRERIRLPLKPMTDLNGFTIPRHTIVLMNIEKNNSPIIANAQMMPFSYTLPANFSPNSKMLDQQLTTV